MAVLTRGKEAEDANNHQDFHFRGGHGARFQRPF
jgi:hypothetical protein